MEVDEIIPTVLSFVLNIKGFTRRYDPMSSKTYTTSVQGSKFTHTKCFWDLASVTGATKVQNTYTI